MKRSEVKINRTVWIVTPSLGHKPPEIMETFIYSIGYHDWVWVDKRPDGQRGGLPLRGVFINKKKAQQRYNQYRKTYAKRLLRIAGRILKGNIKWKIF